ncbi:hypothetical protein JTE90_016499 [Oedothorax gibbosus]|uniref:Cytochrome b5 heme-binding domain-containing protein n=1 Tax=Oedothorax gibbosus TaxID=931172 RepID=A0AAV6U8P7_9ARAC|nr:hypothetical protein JTE90_016499 [Oedothorax gibbosus]
MFRTEDPASVLNGAVTTVLQRLRRLSQQQNKRTDQSYTLSEVSVHCNRNDCWIVVGDNVYDVTPFLDKHPGGFDVLMEQAGRDATMAFYGAGHHPSTFDMLEPFHIGNLAQHERVNIIGTVSNHSVWSRDRAKIVVAD